MSEKLQPQSQQTDEERRDELFKQEKVLEKSIAAASENIEKIFALYDKAVAQIEAETSSVNEEKLRNYIKELGVSLLENSKFLRSTKAKLDKLVAEADEITDKIDAAMEATSVQQDAEIAQPVVQPEQTEKPSIAKFLESHGGDENYKNVALYIANRTGVTIEGITENVKLRVLSGNANSVAEKIIADMLAAGLIEKDESIITEHFFADEIPK